MSTKRSLITICALAVLVVALSGLLEAQSQQGIKRREGNQSLGQDTRASISVMSDGPLMLQIAQPESQGVDAHNPEVELVIANTTEKPVSAYAIGHDVVLNGRLRSGGVELSNISAARFLLQPKDTRTAFIGEVHYSLSIERLVVFVDFVEFTDGTTWGADKYSSREVLAGMRAGAQAASEQLLLLLAEQGLVNFAEKMESVANKVSIPTGHSTKWRAGIPGECMIGC